MRTPPVFLIRALLACALLMVFDHAPALAGKKKTQPPLPERDRNTVLVRKPIIVDNAVFDMKGKTYSGRDRDSQREDGEPLFILKNNAVLKNGRIIRSAEGVWFRGINSRVENVEFPNVYEDAISTRSAKCRKAVGKKRNRIIGCTFSRFKDKAVQLNAGELEVRGCTFTNGVTSIRQNGRSSEPLVLHVYDCTFRNTHSMAKADGKNPRSRVYRAGNEGQNVNDPDWEISGKTKLIDRRKY
ncbi:MAG: pectate lyase [Verrucomicrobiales bacterium]